MKKSLSLPSLNTMITQHPPKMRRNMSIESFHANIVASTKFEEDIEFVATKITLNQVVGCIVTSDKFPFDLLNLTKEDVVDVATCMAIPPDNSDLFQRTWKMWMEDESPSQDFQRLVHLLRKKRKNTSMLSHVSLK